MIEPPSIAAAWSSLFLGLFTLASAMGELRRPGMWLKMVQEINGAVALQMLIGLTELAIGMLLYIVNPWDSGDWLALAMKIIAMLMMFEAMIVCAFSDRYMSFWAHILGPRSVGWALFALVVGLVLIFAATYRFYLTTPY